MLQRWLNVKHNEKTQQKKNTTNIPIATVSEEKPTQPKPKAKPEWTELSLQHFVKYKWVFKKDDGLVGCKFCVQFPNISKQTENFVKGWGGTANGYKFEAFARQQDVPRQQECECGCCVNELARRLCDGTLFSNAMQPFEQSVLLRVTQAKVIFDQVLSP